MSTIAAQCLPCCTCPTHQVLSDFRGTGSVFQWQTSYPCPFVHGGELFGFYTKVRRTVEYVAVGGGSDPCPSAPETDTGYGSDPRVITGLWGGGFGGPQVYVDGFESEETRAGPCCGYSRTEGILLGRDNGLCARITVTYSGLLTDADFIARIKAQLESGCGAPPFDGEYVATAPSAFLSYNRTSGFGSAGNSRYRFRFPIPAVGSGKCYRLAWVERFIPEAGVGVTSVEVISRGVYRPGLSTSAAASGKTAATAVAVMSSAGAVAGISVLVPGDYRPVATITGGGGTGAALEVLSLDPATGGVDQVRITPGSGYTSAPTLSFTNVTSPRVRATATLTVDSDPASPTYRQITGITWTNRGDYRPALTFASAINGGTTATATSSINSLGQLIGATITGGGNYLPTLAFSAGGGTGATATVAMDAQGGIETVTMTASGSAYAAAPSLTITPRITGPIAAVLHLHLGTETARCAAWDGVTPAGYVAATASTWPTLPSGSPGYFEIPVPTSEGTTTIANVRAFCDCSACP